MPVFYENATADRDLRIYRPRPPPLPRTTPFPEQQADGQIPHHEVVVIGAGPAGLFLTVCLARLGLSSDASLICYDAKSETLKAGQADGLQPRTLEVFKSLGILSEIYEDGCFMKEVAFWNPKGKDGSEGIERTTFAPDVVVRARYKHEITIHQGRIERILEEDLIKHASRGVVRKTKFVNFELDETTNAEYPIKIQLEQEQEDGSVTNKTIRSKYLVGADGAHSKVRQSMKLQLEGETTDHIWGVCDFVADTDFPDIRKRSAVHSSAGSIMVIPRERISSGEYLTRLYVQIKDEVEPPTDVMRTEEDAERQRAKHREKRQAVTMEYIFEQANRVLAPYSIKAKEGTNIDWYAAYQIGQRVAPKFAMEDQQGDPRVFIVGDACHTHSPKAGQGMNVSMMDSYNLSWKLAHHISGLLPEEQKLDGVLSSFNNERLTIARQLIDFDRQFSSLFSGQVKPDANAADGLTHEEFLKVFSEGSGFTSGCGIEYPSSIVVATAAAMSGEENGDEYPVQKDGNYLNGCLKPGRRLADVNVVRYADANDRHLQDDFRFDGRYRILVLASRDILDLKGKTSRAIETICQDVIPRFPQSMVEMVVIHPAMDHKRFEWVDISSLIKKHAEMRFHGPGAGVGGDDVYAIYGVDESRGAVAVVRPDGYVGQVMALEDAMKTSDYLLGCLRTVA